MLFVLCRRHPMIIIYEYKNIISTQYLELWCNSNYFKANQMAHGGEKDSTKKMPKKTKDEKIQIQNN